MKGGSADLVTVRFTAPVEGIDPTDGDVFISTRHRVGAVYVCQDRTETLFINDEGEVVARWATRLIDHIEWPDEPAGTDVAPSVGTLEWRREVRERHPLAYQRWTTEEDAQLTEEFRRGQTVQEMAELHQRRRGGITARLIRLGLIELDKPELGNAVPLASPAAAKGAEPARSGALRPTSAPAEVVAVETTEDACRHDLPLGTCSICKYDGRPSVYITAGGVRFHATPECSALLEGQRHVDARGGTTEPIEIVHRGSTRLEGRDTCLVCTPD